MKKMNRKGFTLIELLAVIVILGVVMSIAVVSYNGYITSSKKSGFASSAQLYMRAIKDQMLMDGNLTNAGTYIYNLNKVEMSSGGTSPYTGDIYYGYVVAVNSADSNGNVTNEMSICIYDDNNNYIFASENQLDDEDNKNLVKSNNNPCTKVNDDDFSSKNGFYNGPSSTITKDYEYFTK